MIDTRQRIAKSEVDKYLEAAEIEREEFSFIKIDFLVDMRVAENKYKSDYKNNVNGIKTSKMPFDKWLDLKKYDASKFYVKHSDYNLD